MWKVENLSFRVLNVVQKVKQSPEHCLTLWVSDVEVLRRPLLGAVLGVGAGALLGGHVVQHDGGEAVTCSVVGARHAC